MTALVWYFFGIGVVIGVLGLMESCLLSHSWAYMYDGRFRECRRCKRFEERRSSPEGDVVYREIVR